jgi:segregation and condensation protein B
MEISNLIPHIEALVFASDRPLTTLEITDLLNNAFGFMEDKVTLEQVEAAMEGIVEKYESDFYPFSVRQSGGGWQFLTKKEYHKTVAQLNGDKFLKRLSTAAMETLAIIAYKQPVTKAEIEAIRGVSSDYAIQKLLEKDLIVIIGRNEKLPGHPLVYGTSKSFMDYFGINSPEDLPKLKEVFDDSIVNPTIVNEEAAGELRPEGETEAGSEVPSAEEGGEADSNGESTETNSQFVVREDGELIEESASAPREENEGEEGGSDQEEEEK